MVLPERNKQSHRERESQYTCCLASRKADTKSNIQTHWIHNILVKRGNPLHIKAHHKILCLFKSNICGNLISLGKARYVPRKMVAIWFARICLEKIVSKYFFSCSNKFYRVSIQTYKLLKVMQVFLVLIITCRVQLIVSGCSLQYPICFPERLNYFFSK